MANPRTAYILDTLIAVGLGTIRLGQSATTLSRGEPQRIDLSRELARRVGDRWLPKPDKLALGLPATEPPLARSLKSAGYGTAIFGNLAYRHSDVAARLKNLLADWEAELARTPPPFVVR